MCLPLEVLNRPDAEKEKGGMYLESFRANTLTGCRERSEGCRCGKAWIESGGDGGRGWSCW